MVPTLGPQRLDWSSVKDRIDLAAVATALLGPAEKRQGHRLLWRCPFHDDHDPSLSADPDRGTWKCWPCNLGGDAATLVMKQKGVTFPEAVRIVAELSGVVAASRRSAKPQSRPTIAPAASKPAKAGSTPPERTSGLPLEEASSLVTEAAARLWTPEGTEALAYLHRRGLTDETIRAARLGVVASVSIPTREGDRCYCARGVVIPWFDGDRLALVKIRQPEGAKPKYAEAFRDRPTLYPGLEAIHQGRPLIIAEGEFDRLLLGQTLCNLASVVTLGSSSNRPDPRILGALLAAAPWFIATDADSAGDRAASVWPAVSRRVRPPGAFRDWTEAAQAGVNLRRWWSDRLVGTTAPALFTWDELAAQRWGPALIEEPGADDGSDSYALAEREAIQDETHLELTSD
jgi:hypothetical protein